MSDVPYDIRAKVWNPEPDDHLSPLIRRCSFLYHSGAQENEIRDILLQEGLSEEQAHLTYIAATLLTLSEENPPSTQR